MALSIPTHIQTGGPAIKLGQPDAAVKTAEVDTSTANIALPVRREAVLAELQDHSWETLLDDRALCLELKQRCCLCYEWISSPKRHEGAHPQPILLH